MVRARTRETIQAGGKPSADVDGLEITIHILGIVTRLSPRSLTLSLSHSPNESQPEIGKRKAESGRTRPRGTEVYRYKRFGLGSMSTESEQNGRERPWRRSAESEGIEEKNVIAEECLLSNM